MKIIVNNLATEYQDDGSGAVILFLHGWKDSLHTFDALVTGLIAESSVLKYRLVRLDLPGFGQSETPPQAWSVEDYANFIKTFCGKLNINPDYLVGHSFGGRVIIKAISKHILSPKKIVLIASAGIAKTKSAKNLAFKAIAKIGKFVTTVPPLNFLRDSLRGKLYKAAGSDYLQAGNLKETYFLTVNEDLSADASKIELPTLLVWGSTDSETPLADGQKFAQLIKNSRLEVFQGADHFVHQQEAKKITELIEEFCR